MLKRFGLWRCRVLDWHVVRYATGFDGASYSGRCERCGRRCLSSSGGWFAVEKEPSPVPPGPPSPPFPKQRIWGGRR